MKVLPFYISTGNRDAERVNAWSALLCPRHKLPPFQIQRDHKATTYLTSLALVDCNGAETDLFADYIYSGYNAITGWTNAGYETLDLSGSTILTAIDSNSDTAFCYSDAFTLATGDSVKITYDLTRNGGQQPKFYLGQSGGTLNSTGVSMSTGGYTDYITATSNTSGQTRLLVRVTNDASFSCTFSAFSKNTLPVNEFTSYDFISHDSICSLPLPYGTYYLKASDGYFQWYSEWINIQDLHTSLITGWATSSYDTWTNPTGLVVAQAIDAGGTEICNTNTFATHAGERLTFTYNFKLLTGATPKVDIRDSAGNQISNESYLYWGLNEVELIVTKTDSAAYLRIWTIASTSWQLNTIISLLRPSSKIRIKYTNSKDIQGADSIYYAGGFTQEVYLDTVLNNPSHEIVETGEEKNGVFYPEKLVDKLIYNVVAYVSRNLFKAMRILPMHDDIEIIDEVGNRYTPSVGNVRVGMDWTTYDTGTLRIDFNEEGDVWTSNMDNIT